MTTVPFLILGPNDLIKDAKNPPTLLDLKMEASQAAPMAAIIIYDDRYGKRTVLKDRFDIIRKDIS